MWLSDQLESQEEAEHQGMAAAVKKQLRQLLEVSGIQRKHPIAFEEDNRRSIRLCQNPVMQKKNITLRQNSTSFWTRQKIGLIEFTTFLLTKGSGHLHQVFTHIENGSIQNCSLSKVSAISSSLSGGVRISERSKLIQSLNWSKFAVYQYSVQTDDST